MVTEKTVLRTEAHFSEDKNHRYLLKKEWDKNLEKGCIIMINPSSADSLKIDMTTQLILNNISKLGFGSCDILNLYSMIGKLSVRAEKEENRVDNLKSIMQSVDKCTKIILAYGSIGKSNKSVQKRIDELLSSLESYSDKVFFLSDAGKETLYHPLVPSVRNVWHLIPYFKNKK